MWPFTRKAKLVSPDKDQTIEFPTLEETTMSSPSPILAAAAPSLVAVLQALQAFITNLGTDPAQVAIKFPGALQVFLGTVEMQAPTVAAAEIEALQSAANSKISAWITSLQAKA
jgi:hypothetical protein